MGIYFESLPISEERPYIVANNCFVNSDPCLIVNLAILDSYEPTQTSQGPPTVQPDLKVRPLALIEDSFLNLYLFLLHWGKKPELPEKKPLPWHQ